MSVFKLVTVECDGIACPNYLTTNTDDYDEAVAQAAAQGWARDDDSDEDFCSECKEA